MLVEEIVLEGGSNNVTSLHEISLHEAVSGVPGPEAVLVERGNIHTAGHEHGSCHFSDGLEGTLNSIKDSLEDSYKQSNE